MDLDQLMWSLVLNGAFYLSCNKLTELCKNRICMPSAWRCSRYEPKCNEMLMLHISLHTFEGETRHLSAYTLSRRVCAKETDLSLLKLLGQMVNNKSPAYLKCRRQPSWHLREDLINRVLHRSDQKRQKRYSSYSSRRPALSFPRGVLPIMAYATYTTYTGRLPPKGVPAFFSLR